jgi:hypothetical protein
MRRLGFTDGAKVLLLPPAAAVSLRGPERMCVCDMFCEVDWGCVCMRLCVC